MLAGRSVLSLLTLLLGTSLGSQPAAAQVLRCDIATKYQCDAGSGCQRAAPGLWNVIDLQKQTISRCDSKGCDTYPARFAVSGAYINIALPERGMMAKLASDGSTFMETASLTNAVLVSFGSCKRQ